MWKSSKLRHTEEEYCQLCQKMYPDQQSYNAHKFNNKKHLACLFCFVDFRTHGARTLHTNSVHAASADVRCIGCNVVFERAGAYISHIENRQCPVFHSADVKLRAEIMAITPDKCTPFKDPQLFEPSVDTRFDFHKDHFYGRTEQDPNDLLKFNDNPADRPKWGDDTTAVDGLFAKPLLPVIESLMDVKTRDFTQSTDIVLIPEVRTNAAPDPSVAQLGDFGPRIPLTRNAVAMIDRQDYLLPATLTPSADLAPQQPDHVGKDINSRYNGIRNMWICVYPRCNKAVRTKLALQAHYDSPKHSNPAVKCGRCHRQFNSQTALIQHYDTATKTCDLRETTLLQSTIERDTGGLLSVLGKDASSTVMWTGVTERAVQLSTTAASRVPGSKLVADHSKDHTESTKGR